ncbi:Protein of unknown function [Pyronema omphalodes CBS 100304]|uniref:Uncharacterized protein n=1 Tax=Pyronema omphalodes (strain CBS 100304) TaxID=1076935 RepID=U4L183_PYROM|nr:Protein of unknown function [Pyronema omphalodes CBS 100304]
MGRGMGGGQRDRELEWGCKRRSKDDDDGNEDDNGNEDDHGNEESWTVMSRERDYGRDYELQVMTILLHLWR